MTDTVQTAVYALRYTGGDDSVRTLSAVRVAQEQVAASADKMSVSEERLGKSSMQLLAALDPRIRAEQAAARQLEHFSRLHADGAIGNERYAQTLRMIEDNLKNKVTPANDNAAASVGRFSGALGIARNLLGAFGVALSAAAVVNFARDVIRTTADLDDQADVLGISTDALQAYRAAAIEAGSSTTFIQTALQRYVRSVGEAMEGNTKIIAAFEKLGLTANDIAGDPAASLPKTIRAIGEIKDVTARAAIEVDIFSKSGQQLEQVIKAWATPIDEQIARFKKLNVIISREQIEALDAAQAKWDFYWLGITKRAVDFLDILTKISTYTAPGSPVAQGMGGKGDLFGGLLDSLGRPKPAAQAGALQGIGAMKPWQDSVNITGRTADPFGMAARTAKLTEEFEKSQESLRKEQETNVQQFEKNYNEAMARTAKALNEMFKKSLDAEKKFVSDSYVTARKVADQIELDAQKALEAAFAYAEELKVERKKSTDEFIKGQTAALEKQAEEVKRYWEDINREMTSTYKDFWLEFVDTGELNFETLARRMKQIWASLIFDLVKQWAQAKLGSSAGGFSMGGGGGGGGSILGSLLGGIVAPQASYNASTGNWTSAPGGFPASGVSSGTMWAGAGALGLGLAASYAKGQESPGDNTRVSSGLSGAATGAMIGMVAGPIGAAVGAIIGGIIGLISGGDKISDFRSVATFTPGMTDFGIKAQSAHETSQDTLAKAMAAGDAITAAVSMLKDAGVEFTTQLSNIWLGGRDESTYQMVGGQRISVGTVGDPEDLALDAINALLAKATSSDPEIQAILAKTDNLAELESALSFSKQITDALGQITDPLKAAIDLWKEESQARLDMAEAYGVNIDKVQQLNAALYQQIVGQQNAPTIASLDQFINSLQYGPGSAASPKNQITAAFSDYDAARQAALMKPSAETAAAFQQAAGAYLPLAREFYGSGGGYASAVSSATNAAEQLKGFLGATPAAAPDLTPVIQTAANITVDAIQGTTAAVSRLEARIDRWNGILESLMSRVKEPV